MSTIAKRTRQLREDLGFSQSELARAIGITPQSVQALEAGRVTRPKYIVQLAKILNVEPSYLESGDLPKRDPFQEAIDRGDATMEYEISDGSPPPGSGKMRDIPIMGTIPSSVTGASQLSTEHVDYVRRPPALMRTKHVYALYVEGDSMEPRHYAGELLFINPNRKPQKGDSVVLQLNPDGEEERHNREHFDVITVYVGYLVSNEPNKIEIGKFNPPEALEFNRSAVKALHKVMTLNEVLGV